MPVVERALNEFHFPLTGGLRLYIQSRAYQAARHIAGNHKGVFAHIAQNSLPGHAAKARAVFL